MGALTLSVELEAETTQRHHDPAQATGGRTGAMPAASPRQVQLVDPGSSELSQRLYAAKPVARAWGPASMPMGVGAPRHFVGH